MPERVAAYYVQPGIAALPPDDQWSTCGACAPSSPSRWTTILMCEHDFGSFECAGTTIFWKIDLYEEPDVKSANGEPVVTRVLTIMLAEEY